SFRATPADISRTYWIDRKFDPRAAPFAGSCWSERKSALSNRRRSAEEGHQMHGKIAFEEHYNLPEFEIPEYADAAEMREIRRRLLDVSEQRLADMDDTGIDYAILSLVSPDIQSETDAGQAV